MDLVFLDANVLFSSAYRVEPPLRTLFTMLRAQLVTSAYALEEARRNLSSGQQQTELERLCRSVEVVSVLPQQGALSILSKVPKSDRPIWADHQRCHHHATSGLSQRAPRVIVGDGRL